MALSLPLRTDVLAVVTWLLSCDRFLCDPVDCSPPGSSLHGIFQVILEWVAVSFSRGSSQPRDWTWVSWIGRQILYHCTTWEALVKFTYWFKFSHTNSINLSFTWEILKYLKIEIIFPTYWKSPLNIFFSRFNHSFLELALIWTGCIRHPLGTDTTPYLPSCLLCWDPL